MYLEMGVPAIEPVTLDEAKKHLRLVDTITTTIEPEEPGGEPITTTSHPDDDYITQLIATAREWGELFQGRSWITRDITVYLDAWPCGSVRLPMGPAQKITSMSYFAQDNTEVTVDPTTYWLSPDGRLCPISGKDWPTVTLRDNLGVKVAYKAGYGDTAVDVPLRYKHAILLMVGHWYENREEVIVGISATSVAQIPAAAEMLLYQDREIPA